MSRRIHVLTVAGEMDEVLCDQFDDVELTLEHGVTRLRMLSADPSALHGLIHRLEALDLDLLDIRSIDEMPPG